MTRKRQLLSNSITLRIRLRKKRQLGLSGVPDVMELAANLDNEREIEPDLAARPAGVALPSAVLEPAERHDARHERQQDRRRERALRQEEISGGRLRQRRRRGLRKGAKLVGRTKARRQLV